ncbi:penicillin-insensitive murein endopeptidase [Tianweitania sediminis]|nr:penicillin-insensitive murein endopeptidase [Tianweitania sediminis]
MMPASKWIRAVIAALALAVSAPHVPATAAEPLAKDLFGSKPLPAAMPPKAYGFYSKGCFSGGVAISVDGPNWQAMRLSRNRRWGHPELVQTLERLARDGAAKDGWNGLMIGDLSQPRGGPMLSGHASHQIGLDADIWFTPMPDRRLSVPERESFAPKSMIQDGGLTVDDRLWTPAHAAILKRAASYGNVERILVHPGIKKKLCETVKGDRGWLNKIRPFWGHDYHFHVRIGCPAGSVGCKEQESTGSGDGCDKSLAWWFTEEPWRPATGPQKPRARDVMTMKALPKECRVVLDAPSPRSEASVTVGLSATADPVEATSVPSAMQELPSLPPLPSDRPAQ